MEEHPVNPKKGSPAGAGPAQHYVLRNLRPFGRWLRGLCIAAVVLGSVAPARAGDLTIRQIGAWGGSVDAIHVEEVGDQRIAYIGSGVNLVILDVTDPANLIELGSVMLEGVVMDVKVRDGLAYIAASNPAWLTIVDVRDPAAPFVVTTRVGPFMDTGPTINYVDLDGSGRWAFVTPRTFAPTRIDVSDPASAVWGRLHDCGFYSYPLFFSGSLAYGLAPYSGRVAAVDYSTCPATVLGSIFIEEYNLSLALTDSALSGNYLYVGAHKTEPVRHSSIFIVDFSDLTAPVLAGIWGDPTGEELQFANALAVSDGRLYWAGSGRFDPLSRTLVILDIAAPTAPRLIGQYSSDAAFSRIQVVGTTAYLGDMREGFTILDCSDPASPQRVGNYFSPKHIAQGALDGANLYVTDSLYGLTVVDVADPRRPSLVGKWETGTYTSRRVRMQNWGIAVRDDLAYVAAGHAGLQVLDVSDPGTPTLAGTFSPWPDGRRSVGLALAPDEPIVHLGTIPGAFVVNFDVRDLSDIADVGAVFIGGSEAEPLSIVRRPDGIAYVARQTALATVDLRHAEGPELVHVGDPPALDAAIDGDRLYVVNESRSGADISGLDVFSIVSPGGIPGLMSHYGHDGLTVLWGDAVAGRNGRAYVGMHPTSLRVFDVTMPGLVLPLGASPCANVRIRDLILDGPYVYAIGRPGTSNTFGVLVYHVFYQGDLDDDGDVDLRDFATLQRCFGGGAAVPAGRAGADCLIFDFDEDDDVDAEDYAAFAAEMTEPR